mgnify:CR=1 FL=1
MGFEIVVCKSFRCHETWWTTIAWCFYDVSSLFLQLESRGEVSDLSSIMAEAVCASSFCCKQDVFGFDVPIGYKGYVVEILNTISNLRENKTRYSLFHWQAGVHFIKLLELLFCWDLLSQKVNYALVHFVLGVTKCAQISILQHQIHLVMPIWFIVLKPNERFAYIVMLELAPKFDFVHDHFVMSCHTKRVGILTFTKIWNLRVWAHTIKSLSSESFKSIGNSFICVRIVPICPVDCAKLTFANLFLDRQKIVQHFFTIFVFAHLNCIEAYIMRTWILYRLLSFFFFWPTLLGSLSWVLSSRYRLNIWAWNGKIQDIVII